MDECLGGTGWTPEGVLRERGSVFAAAVGEHLAGSAATDQGD